MERRKVVMIEGDGIGPEVCAAVRTVIAATEAPIDWIMAEAGAGCLSRHGSPLPDKTIALMREHAVGIKGPTETPTGKGYRSVNVRLREALGLSAGVRPVRTIPGLVHPLSALKRTVDLVIVRENLEGLYAGHEYLIRDPEPPLTPEELVRDVSIKRAWEFTNMTFTSGTAIALKVITPERTRKIVRYAFEYARRHGRKRVTCVHKANILKQTDGLFLAIFREEEREFPDIAADDVIVDAMAMHLVRNPEQFDVLVCPNLYGDILSDLAAALVGGLGVVGGANIGDDIVLFEAVHGTAQGIAGQGKANPTALLLSACMMLEHIGQTASAALVREAIEEVVADRAYCTPDLISDAEFAELRATRAGFRCPAHRAGTTEMAARIAEVIYELREAECAPYIPDDE